MGNKGAPIHLRLTAQALRYRGTLALAIFVLAGASLLTIVTPALAGYAIDTGLNVVGVTGTGGVVTDVAQGNMRTLMAAVGLLLGAALLRGLFVYLQTYLSESISQTVARDLRNQVYDRLQTLSFGYHDKAEVGEIMSRATGDVEGVRFFVSMGVIRLIYILIIVGISYGLMIATNPKVGLIAAAFVPLVAIQSGWVAMRMRPVWLLVQQMQGHMATILQENLTGQRVVKAFSRQRYEQQKFDAKVDELFDWSYSTAKFQAFNEPFLVSVWILSTAVVFWVGATELEAGRMTAGDLAAFQLWLALLQVPVRSIGFVVNIFARAHSAGTRLYEILDADSPVQEKPGAQPLRPGPGHVVFDHVSFGYSPDRRIVSDVSVDALPGQTIALLGPTGSGKTSVVNLLPRFYDVTEGAITIDGEDVRDVTLDSLRDAIGLVQQDVFLFSATIRENIAYGRPDATDAEVEEAAKAARIHDFIVSQPDGYETWVGERGSTLSGGQRQRVAIARTLLLDPRVLIFDDSTAAVDMRTEFQIQEALRTLMEGRTTFVIAQRLRTVKEADLILVMRDGVVVERGKHDELLALDGFYRRIY
ncbi:MAG: ABC transporter ATP-binding protein, partial [Dehalococcoidia bacterium]